MNAQTLAALAAALADLEAAAQDLHRALLSGDPRRVRAAAARQNALLDRVHALAAAGPFPDPGGGDPAPAGKLQAGPAGGSPTAGGGPQPGPSAGSHAGGDEQTLQAILRSRVQAIARLQAENRRLAALGLQRTRRALAELGGATPPLAPGAGGPAPGPVAGGTVPRLVDRRA